MAGWSVGKMDEKARKQEFEDTEDMVQWRCISEGIKSAWRTLADKFVEEVLEKYKVKVSKSGAIKGRGEPSECWMVQRVKKYQPQQWGEDCWAKTFWWFRDYDLQRKQGMQESLTEKEEVRQQQRMKVVTDLTNKIKSKGRMHTDSSTSVSELLAADCQKNVLYPGLEAMVQLAA